MSSPSSAIGAALDHGAILHAAGARHLSPALDGQGHPAFSAGPGDGLVRCGWPAFFEALARKHLVVVFADGADGDAPPSFVPQAAAPRAAHPGLAGALAHARRFWAALMAKPSP